MGRFGGHGEVDADVDPGACAAVARDLARYDEWNPSLVQRVEVTGPASVRARIGAKVGPMTVGDNFALEVVTDEPGVVVVREPGEFEARWAFSPTRVTLDLEVELTGRAPRALGDRIAQGMVERLIDRVRAHGMG